MKQPAVYIMANKRNGTLYVGVTSNLIQRVYAHKEVIFEKSFTGKYDCKMLVFYEMHADMLSAISREKQLKAGTRKKKIALIVAMNPEWEDLYETIIG